MTRIHALGARSAGLAFLTATILSACDGLPTRRVIEVGEPENSGEAAAIFVWPGFRDWQTGTGYNLMVDGELLRGVDDEGIPPPVRVGGLDSAELYAPPGHLAIDFLPEGSTEVAFTVDVDLLSAHVYEILLHGDSAAPLVRVIHNDPASVPADGTHVHAINLLSPAEATDVVRITYRSTCTYRDDSEEDCVDDVPREEVVATGLTFGQDYEGDVPTPVQTEDETGYTYTSQLLLMRAEGADFLLGSGGERTIDAVYPMAHGMVEIEDEDGRTILVPDLHQIEATWYGGGAEGGGSVE